MRAEYARLRRRIGRRPGTRALDGVAHLKELRRVGLIHMKRAGQHVECWADPEALARLGDFFNFAGGDVPPQLVAFTTAQQKTKGDQR